MNAPRDHHFIPAFYFKQWVEGSGKLVEYSRKGGKLISKPAGPRSTGFERDLYAFPELPVATAQYMERVFFAYADQKASDALDLHLGLSAQRWTPELLSAWSRLVIGIHLRHPDAMPELRSAAEKIRSASGEDYQARYEAVRKPGDPATFDEYLALRDPLTAIKMQVNLIIKTLDNDIVGAHINRMKWATIDLSGASERLLTSDRPVEIFNLKEPNGVLSIPIGPTKIFVAVNDPATFDKLRAASPNKIVADVNNFTVSRARRFVWACGSWQAQYVAERISKKMEPTPLLPNIDKYQGPAPAALIDEALASDGRRRRAGRLRRERRGRVLPCPPKLQRRRKHLRPSSRRPAE